MNQNKDPRRNAKTSIDKSDAIFRKKRIKENKKKNKEQKERSIFSKILSGFAIFILTVLLIGFITGLIVGGAFAMYIKNYIDPVIDDFDTISTEQKLS